MKLLTTKSVAEMLSVPEGTIRYWRKVGQGPDWIKLEGSIRYAVEDVLRYIQRNRRTPSVRAHEEEKNESVQAE
jgi:DNA-binding transcriptional MerR regulator